ncbi:C13 family peptidase [Oryzibacter oryziterrae]|uniref:C13 family peptidase n=1 Tax=Oryzibacter oryziterrae TaxID=2766474 RepID=UPI001F3BA323|nr:C13 family peptidase [Oryzibacter oryziterrae]
MQDFVRAVWRCLTFRRFDPYDLPQSLPLVLGGVFVWWGTNLLGQWACTFDGWRFNEYGVNYSVATAAVFVGLMLVVYAGNRLLAKMAVSLWSLSVVNLIATVYGAVLGQTWRPLLQSGHWLGLAIGAGTGVILFGLWWLSNFAIVLRSFDPFQWRRPIIVCLAQVAVTVSLPYLLPFDPIFYSDAVADAAPRPVWMATVDYMAPAEEPDEKPAEVVQAEQEAWYRDEWDQTRAIDQTLARLPETNPDKPTLYMLTLGGMTQGVFDRESRRAGEIMTKTFDIGTRSVRLNNGETGGGEPVATVDTLQRSIAAIGKRMHGDRDALILFLTSHGSETGVALSGPHAVESHIRPLDLRFALDQAGIRNRILIVSACHSGVFVPVFSDDHSAVFTAAATDRTSFGCNDTNTWTFFGDAFFAHGLKEQHTLVGAFVAARKLIWTWEAKLEQHSLPQVHVGKAIAADFATVIGNPAELVGTDPASEVAPSPQKTAQN